MKKTIYCAIAAMAFAGIFTACEEKAQVETPLMPSGENTAVTIGIKAFSSNNGVQYAPAGDLYLGDNPAKISNIFVVPMVGENASETYKLGDITVKDRVAVNKVTSEAGTVINVDKNTNRFLVYANAAGITEGAVFNPATQQFSIGTAQTEKLGSVSVYNDYPVYLFADAKYQDGATTQNLYFAKTTEVNPDWTFITDETWNAVANADETVGDNTDVKITGVKYAVASLATAVYHGDYATATGAEGEVLPKYYVGSEAKDYAKDNLDADVKLLGVMVNKQPSALKYNFAPDYTTEVSVYELMNNGDNAAAIKEYAAERMTMTTAPTNANTFVVLAPEKQNETKDSVVTVQFVFQNTTNKTLRFDGVDADGNIISGKEIPAGAKFFIAAKLGLNGTNAEGHNNIFEVAKTTLLNAVITHWEKATTEPQTDIKVEIGIEVDLSWGEGIVYDAEI